MDTLELSRLERVARNLIDHDLRMERVEDINGIIYIAHGMNLDGAIVGVWGCRGIARNMEFKDDTSLDDVRRALISDAAGMVEMMAERDLLNGG